MAKQDEPQSGPPDEGVQRLTPVDVQQKQFRLAFRGYNEREVDEFLDQVTEELARLHAENRRWQEELGARRTMPMATGGAAETEHILARARQEADRILADAETEARALLADTRRVSDVVGTDSFAGTGEGPFDSRTGDFLGREKDFLQRLAGIIQEHAEAVKQDLRDIREATLAAPVDQPSAMETGPERYEPPGQPLSPTTPFVPEPYREPTEYGQVASVEEPEVVAGMPLVEGEEAPATVGGFSEPEPEPEPAEPDWAPPTPEVEVVRSAEPLEEPGPPPWEATGTQESVQEPETEPEPTIEPEAEPTPVPESEPPADTWEPSQPSEEPTGPQATELDSIESPSAWESVEETSMPGTPGEPEPESWSGESLPPDELDADIEPEAPPTSSGEPSAGASGWDEPAEEALQAEEFLFEQPTLTGEPSPPRREDQREPESGGPQGFDRGMAGDEIEDDGEDRSLRELFWGED